MRDYRHGVNIHLFKAVSGTLCAHVKRGMGMFSFSTLDPIVKILTLMSLLVAFPALARGPMPGIIGHDDRVPLDTESWPWQALGRVNQAGGVHCTGALIAKDAVLTAAHCLMDRRTGLWLDAHELVFVAGYRRDEDLGFARGRDMLHSARAIDPRKPTVLDVADDWAVLYLEHALNVRPIPVHPLPPAENGIIPVLHLMLAGYSQDRPHMLSLHDGCGLLDRLDNGRILATDCDSTRGDSGSPLLLKEGKKIWIVGVASAIVTRGVKLGSYAVDAAAFFDRLGKLR